MGWIGVDLDGTLATYEGNHHAHIGAPIFPMVMRVKVWLDEGREVKIFTARVSHGPDLEQRRLIAEWTQLLFGRALEATCVKDDACEALYDDRAFRVEHNTGTLL